MMYEKQVLLPYDISLDQESWPLLTLTDAIVYKPRRGRSHPSSASEPPSDLLDVQDIGPFRLKGRLAPIPSSYPIIIPGRESKIYSEPITIVNISTYSIQALTDGGYTLWALGQCAWYAIEPSEVYKPFMKTMAEKMSLWSFLQDRYKDGNVRVEEDGVGRVYMDYWAEIKDNADTACVDVASAEALFERFHRYLMFEMCGPNEDTMFWKRTPLWRLWNKMYKKEVAEVLKKTGVHLKPGFVKEDEDEDDHHNDDGDDGVECSDRSAGPSRTKPKKLFKKEPVKKKPGPKRQIKTTKAATPPRPRQASKLRKPNFPSYEDSRVTPGSESESIQIMNSPPSSQIVYPIFNTGGPSSRIKAEPGLGSPTEPRRRIKAEHGTTEAMSEIPEYPRSTAGSLSIKAEIEPDVMAAADDNPRAASAPNRIGRKGMPALRPVRRINEYFEPRLKKRPNSSSSNEDFDSDPDDEPARPAPKRTRTKTTAKTANNSRGSTPVPSFAAPPTTAVPRTKLSSNRPGGLWVCEIAGCKEELRDADSCENTALIERHYEAHGTVMRRAMEAVGEEMHPRRHVDNLLAKIERMANFWASSDRTALTGGGGF